MLITGVGTLIHIYSVGYMAHDPRAAASSPYLNLFVASMLLLVLADSTSCSTSAGRAWVSSSYLLIGFWLDRGAAVAAKAFVANRVGDVGLSIACAHVHDVRLGHLPGRAVRPGPRELGHPHLIGLALLLAACGKSAVPAADLAARRDGGPDPGLGPA